MGGHVQSREGHGRHDLWPNAVACLSIYGLSGRTPYNRRQDHYGGISTQSAWHFEHDANDSKLPGRTNSLPFQMPKSLIMPLPQLASTTPGVAHLPPERSRFLISQHAQLNASSQQPHITACLKTGLERQSALSTATPNFSKLTQTCFSIHRAP